MITIHFSDAVQDYEAWDAFLYAHPCGIYNQYSDWVKSYESYGFSSGFLLIKDQETLVGGASYVVASFLFFKFLIVPCGPVVLPGYEEHVDTAIQSLYQKAHALGCCYFQLSLPVSSIPTDPKEKLYIAQAFSCFFKTGTAGTYFKYVIPLYGMRLVDLTEKSMDTLRNGYAKNHLRNVRKGEKKGLAFRWVSSEDSATIAMAYHCFEQNAKIKGYPFRSYAVMQTHVKALLAKGYARIGVCEWQGKLVGALYVMVCGGRYTYIHGGVYQQHSDKGVSHFMHDWVMRDALQQKHSFYDLSVGGSQGVVRFKKGFGSQLVSFENPRYWVLKPLVFYIYKAIAPVLKSQKSKVAALLFFLKKKK